MSTSTINSQTDFYLGDNAYRDNLIAALHHFNFTEFKEGEEFWTLGAKEWHEYDYLRDNGIKFGPGTYCNVDRGRIDTLTDSSTRRYDFTEFKTIDKLWFNPRVICYDSTEGLVDRNVSVKRMLVGLVDAAVRLSGSVLFTCNFMVSYGGAEFNSNDQMIGIVKHWMDILEDHCGYEGLAFERYNNLVEDSKDRSRTRMICWHYLIKTM